MPGLVQQRDEQISNASLGFWSKNSNRVSYNQLRKDGRPCDEKLYPDACGGGGRGWISQGMASSGRGHGTRETCALHTARLSCDTLVYFWSVLGEETRQSLLRMKEEDFIERLMYRLKKPSEHAKMHTASLFVSH